MVNVPLGLSTHKRELAQTTPISMVNMYAERSPESPDGLIRLQRPALKQQLHVDAGPVRGVYQQAGTFGGRFLVVSGPTAALVNEGFTKTLITGTVTGSTRVNMAANALKALIATGDILYSTDGTTLTQVIVPDDLPISSVEEMNGYFVAAQTASQRIWFLAPGDVNFNALNFFSAEAIADNVVGIRRLGDELFIFGESSIETHAATGNASLPFQRIQGKVFSKGCANRDTIVSLDNTLFFVGTDKTVYRLGGVPERISDNGIEERLRKAEANAYRAWAFSMDGHSFYVLTIGNEGTFAFDVSMQNWVLFKTYGRETFRAHVGTQSSGSFIMCGDDTTGDIYTMEAGKSTDNGEILERELTGFVPIIGKPQRCNDFTVVMATGQYQAGEEPSLMFTWSDDMGNTFESWDFLPLGKTGEFWNRVIARQLGAMHPPGRTFKIRYTHNSMFRVSYATMNDAFEARAA
jgi:hypothetical protein